MYTGRDIIFTPGGGAVAHTNNDFTDTRYEQANTACLRNFGTLFYLIPSSNLEESALVLAERQLRDPTSTTQRPPLTRESNAYTSMFQTLQQRDAKYRAACDYTILTGSKTIDQVANEILGIHAPHILRS